MAIARSMPSLSSSCPCSTTTTSSSNSRADPPGGVGVARDGDLVPAHEDAHRERGLDTPEQLVVLSEQIHHEVVPRDEHLDLVDAETVTT